MSIHRVSLIDYFYFYTGKSVRSKGGTIRAFISNDENDIENRCNALYDQHIFFLSQVSGSYSSKLKKELFFLYRENHN